jgi:hypothetical protein
MTSGIGYGGTVDIGKISETTGADPETEVNGQPARQAGAGPDGQPAAEPAKPEPTRQAAAPDVGPRDQARLVFASFLMLFVELALIRWVTANNVYVTKATNFVLLASFLGIGIGFLNARGGRDYLRWTPVALLALVGFVLAFPVILARLSGPHPLQGLGGTPALPQPVSLAIVFLLTTGVMTGLGQAVARIFVRFKPLSAYRLDIVGSIAGIAVFSGLSFLDLPPAGWGIIAGCGLVVLLLPRVRWWQIGAVAVIITLLVLESVLPQQRWSPYNKLSYIQTGGQYPALNVSANNIPYQAARGLPALHAQKPFYFYPYRHVTRASLNNVLIIGSGTGNDAAVALSEGAKHVDAVEIDPVLPKIGRVHPDHPYQNPRLTLHIADGREYLQNTNKKYNLIVFALPDSLSALAGQGGLRLESYLLTEQSLAAARSRLAPGGTFAMYNYYAPFLFNRYATTLQDVYHRAPCAEVGPPLGGRRLSVLTVRPAGPVPNCASVWHGTAVAPATDDHPFPYLPTASLPGAYLLMLGLILAGAALLVRLGGGRFRSMRSYLDLAFMGAAFLLLETKNIVQFALLFGATWFVNALVFAGVLVAVYLAVETARWVRLPRPAVLYAALIAALAVAWLVPQESLLGLPLVPRFLAASALAFAPVFLANLVFAQRFSDVETSNTAFAANLLGAMVGGTLEYIALITGYHFLLIVIGVLYGFAFVIGRRLQRA